ncbi:MAG: hypothetical protein AMJ90_07815 [candidate division Zixibacteria bacterium SM23_73_2]|nr:MAG: hypothetical protein AMJ90_07815 [candidate division Zixibacteria bacterium SM23_73_2]
MDFQKEQIQKTEKTFGKPKELKTSFPMGKREFEDLLSSMRDGRSSDITLVIFKDKRIIVIAKPWYPEGLWRMPSGGWRPDESFLECAKRESYEETGVKIELEKYLLRINVTFAYNKKEVKWTSHIFIAKYLSGKLRPVDRREIKKVGLLTLEKLEKLKPLLLKQNSGGLAYRAFLTEETIKEIRNK